MSHIAFIGIGVMGAPMAGHLVRQGHSVAAWNRHYDKMTAPAAAYGFTPKRTLAEAVEGAELIFTMLGFPPDVEDVYLREGGLFDLAKKGTLIIDLTTSSPALAERLWKLGRERGLRLLDAPVSGGDSGAKKGSLVVMCGGAEEDFQEALPYLQSFGKDVRLLGPAGFGQHCKACNQIAVAGATSAYTEALCYARKAGLDPALMFSVIAGGAAGSWQIDNMAPRAMQGDIDPGFFIKHFIKDMRIAIAEAEAKGLELPMTKTVLSLYEDMQKEGQEDLGTQALFLHYES